MTSGPIGGPAYLSSPEPVDPHAPTVAELDGALPLRLDPPCEHPVTITGRFDVVTAAGEHAGRFAEPLTVCFDCHAISAPQEDPQP